MNMVESSPADARVSPRADLAAGDSQADDRQLLARWCERQDELALAILIERYRGLIQATCRRVLRHSGDLEDPIQETLISFAKGAHGIQGPLGPWLSAVATHRAISHARQRRRRHWQALLEEASGTPAAEQPSTLDQDMDLVDACMVELDAKDRDLIVQLFYLGHSQAEVARTHSVSRVAILKRMQRVLARLRSRLARRGMPVGIPALVLMLCGGHQSAAAEIQAALPRRPLWMAPLGVAGAIAMAGLLVSLWMFGDIPEPVVESRTEAVEVAAPSIAPATPPTAVTAGAEISYQDLSLGPGMLIGGGVPGYPMEPFLSDALRVIVQNVKDPPIVPQQPADGMALWEAGFITLRHYRFAHGFSTKALLIAPPPETRIVLFSREIPSGNDFRTRFAFIWPEDPISFQAMIYEWGGYPDLSVARRSTVVAASGRYEQTLGQVVCQRTPPEARVRCVTLMTDYTVAISGLEWRYQDGNEISDLKHAAEQEPILMPPDWMIESMATKPLF